MNILALKGAQLYYDVVGQGPVLILIPGANGTGDIFNSFKDQLKDQFTVVTFDRRGFGESKLTEPLPECAKNAYDDYRINRDVKDVVALSRHLSEEPVYVFGSSSGAIVAMHILKNNPEIVKQIAFHEPPINTFLPDSTYWKEKNEEIVDDMLNKGLEAGIETFSKKNNASNDDLNNLSTSKPKNEIEQKKKNKQILFWAKYEIRQYTHSNMTIENLASNKDKITLLTGEESNGNFVYNVNQYIAEQLDIDVVETPGGHFGYVKQPAAFRTVILSAWL